MGKWRWSKDKWNSLEHTYSFLGNTLLLYDKVQHFIGGLLVFLVFIVTHRLVGYPTSPLFCFTLATSFWWAWEIKDALVPHEKYGWWGGDGFSWRDAVASTAGAAVGFVVYLLFNSMFALGYFILLVIAAALCFSAKVPD